MQAIRWLVFMFMFLLGACTVAPPSPAPAAPPSAEPTVTLVAETVLPAATAPTESAAAPTLPDRCAPRSDALALYVNVEHGYCLLYPAEFRMTSYGPGSVNIASAPVERDFAHHPSASLGIHVEDMSAAETLAQWVDRVEAQKITDAGASGVSMSRTSTTVGDVPAEVLDGVQGQFISRALFMIHEGQGYNLTLHPVDELVPEVQPQIDMLWQAVQDSFTFLPTDFLATYNACPPSTETAFAYLAAQEGYCLLVESGTSGAFVLANPGGDISLVQPYRYAEGGGPPLEHVSLLIAPSTLGRYASAEEHAAAAIAEYPDIAADVRQSTLPLGGETAVVVDNLQGVTNFRRAFVYHQGRGLELLATPYEDPAIPDAQPIIQMLWDRATASFTWVPALQ